MTNTLRSYLKCCRLAAQLAVADAQGISGSGRDSAQEEKVSRLQAEVQAAQARAEDAEQIAASVQSRLHAELEAARMHATEAQAEASSALGKQQQAGPVPVLADLERRPSITDAQMQAELDTAKARAIDVERMADATRAQLMSELESAQTRAAEADKSAAAAQARMVEVQALLLAKHTESTMQEFAALTKEFLSSLTFRQAYAWTSEFVYTHATRWRVVAAIAIALMLGLIAEEVYLSHQRRISLKAFKDAHAADAIRRLASVELELIQLKGIAGEKDTLSQEIEQLKKTKAELIFEGNNGQIPTQDMVELFCCR